jgi:phosphate transport system protein|tara:strand:+ start:3318 stop:4004 length:687 start_codon:yes stop_codon:yes gene_type:complete
MIEIHDHISSSFNNELSVLDDSLIEMGSNLEKMFEETLLAINEKDEALAKKVISSDKNIDELEISVISQIQTLIAKRQPVGVDLRVLVGCTRIAGYMERIGDLLSSICKRVVILIEHSVEKEKEELIKLSTAVNNLFKLSLNAFAKKDFELAEKVRNEDVDIDKLYKGFFNSLLEKMSKDSKLAVPGTHMLFISKNLERIGDHATNVAETITYMASGEIKIEPRPKIN